MVKLEFMKEKYFKKFKDTTEHAEVKLYHPDPETTLITKVFVPPIHRNEGIGTDLLNMITADADKECKMLLVQPKSPFIWDKGNRINIRLREFYRRFGFEDGHDDYMIRKPNPKEQGIK